MEVVPIYPLPGNTGVEIDGDIVSFADAGIDPEEIVTQTREDPDPSDLLDAAMSEDNSARNRKLVELSDRTSKRNSLHGQLQQTLEGKLRYSTAGELEERRDAQTRRIHVVAAKACEVCSLTDFCLIGPEKLAERLDEDAKTRARFKKRVEHSDNSELCETNLLPGRLPKTH